MSEAEVRSLPWGARVLARIGGAYVVARLLDRETYSGYWVVLRREGRTRAGGEYPSIVRRPSELRRLSLLDEGTTNVYADWLEERGQFEAARILRAAFPGSGELLA